MHYPSNPSHTCLCLHLKIGGVVVLRKDDFFFQKETLPLPSPCTGFPSPSRSIHFGDLSRRTGGKHIRLDHVTRKTLTARNNEAWGLGELCMTIKGYAHLINTKGRIACRIACSRNQDFFRLEQIIQSEKFFVWDNLILIVTSRSRSSLKLDWLISDKIRSQLLLFGVDLCLPCRPESWSIFDFDGNSVNCS